MNVHDLVSQLLVDMKGEADAGLLQFTSDSSLGVFLPEIVICATIVLVLLLRLPRWSRQINAAWITLAGSLVALAFAVPASELGTLSDLDRMEIFTGMLVHDGFSVFLRCLLLAFLALFVIFVRLSDVAPVREDCTDICVLLLGATLGFCLMASANHLLMVFMAVEMASVPSYALAGMSKRHRLGSEAALKYAVYGAGAAGIMLYGISLLAGLVNAVHLPTVAIRLAERMPEMGTAEFMVLALALLMISAGLAFKLSAVPFHFWCPDVFEGAPAEVGGFLSVASKAAALALLVRVVAGVGWIAPEGVLPGERTAARADVAAPERAVPLAHELSLVAAVKTAEPSGAATLNRTNAGAGMAEESAAQNQHLAQLRTLLAQLIALLAAVTCTFGNLAAYGQSNLKRLFAYSTIAHAGYMMMAVPAILELVGRSTYDAQNAVAALPIYISVYLFMNLGAFVIIAFVRNRTQSEQIDTYAGLLRSSPGVAICFSLILFGLIGLPPLSGFVGKFAVFASLTDAFRASGKGYLMALFLIGGINTAISLFYYLRVVRVMTMSHEPAGFRMPMTSPQGVFILLLTLPTAFLMFAWEPLGAAAFAAARSLFG